MCPWFDSRWHHAKRDSEILSLFFCVVPSGTRVSPTPLTPTSPLGRLGRCTPLFFQLCGILTVICYSSGRKGAFASFLGTTVMFFKSFPLQLSAIVCMCMAVVKFSGHVTPSWSAVWATRRGFCGRLPGSGHGTYLQRLF